MPLTSDAFEKVVAAHQILNIGASWYVDGTSGNDSNTGEDPWSNPLATITEALSKASAGDTIVVAAGTYDEGGLNLNKSNITLKGDGNVTITNTTPGTVLTVSAANCTIRNLVIAQAGQVGVHITGSGCTAFEVVVITPTIGFDIDVSGVFMSSCIVSIPTVTGFDFGAASTFMADCLVLGAGGATRGFYFSDAAADQCLLRRVTSSNNATAGFELVAGADQNLILDAVTGGGDGPTIDNGSGNVFVRFDGAPVEQAHHEHVYPFPDGEGGAGSPISVNSNAGDETHAAATSQNFWGEPSLLLAPGTFTKDWIWLGLYLYADTINKELRSAAYKLCPFYNTTRNGGNAWDEGETTLTVTDGSFFEVDDLAWVVSDYVQAVGQGEIVKITNIAGNVLTIARETSQFAAPNTGLRWNHTTNEKIYVAQRQIPEFHGFEFDFSAASSRDFTRYSWHRYKAMEAGCGIVVRVQNSTDGTNGSAYDCTLIYED